MALGILEYDPKYTPDSICLRGTIRRNLGVRAEIISTSDCRRNVRVVAVSLS